MTGKPRDAHLARFFEISLELLCVAGLDGYVKELNPAWEVTLGYPTEELMARPFMEFIHPDDVARVLSAFGIAGSGGATEPLECRIRSIDGSYRWLRWSSNYVLEDDLIYGVARDVTQLRNNEESQRESAASFGLLVEAMERNVDALRESEARFQAVFESAAVGIALADMTGILVEVNPAFAGFLGRAVAQLRGHRLSEFANAEDSLDVQALLDELMDGARSSYRVERRFVRGDGSVVPGRETVSLIRDAAGHPQFVVAMVEDLSLALVDELTGLHNRRAFMAFGEQELHLAVREQRTPALLFLDVDGMKSINDTFGHVEGDRALSDLAGIIVRSFRVSDLPARYGGDEFCVLLYDGGNPQTALTRLEEALTAWNAEGRRPYALSVSVGAALFDWGAPASIEALIAEADGAMYFDKAAERTEGSIRRT